MFRYIDLIKRPLKKEVNSCKILKKKTKCLFSKHFQRKEILLWGPFEMSSVSERPFKCLLKIEMSSVFPRPWEDPRFSKDLAIVICLPKTFWKTFVLWRPAKVFCLLSIPCHGILNPSENLVQILSLQKILWRSSIFRRTFKGPLSSVDFVRVPWPRKTLWSSSVFRSPGRVFYF